MSNIYFIPTLLAAVSALLIGIFVVIQNTKSNINRSFFKLTLATFLWQIGTAFVLISSNPEIALKSTRIGFLGIALIPITTYQLIISFLGIERENKRIIAFGYLINFLCFIPLSWTSYMFNGVYKFHWGYWYKAGVLHPVFLILFGYFMFLAFYQLYNSYRREKSPFEKNRKKYLFVALLIAYIGVEDYLPTYGLNIYPFGYLLVIGCIFILAYAIIRHQLMDIEVIIKKSLVFAGMFVFAFGVFVGITLLVSQIFGAGRIISLAISALLITIGLRPIEAWLVNATDKFLFQKKYEYKQILKAFIDEVITVLNLDEIITSTLKLLDQALHPYAAAIFILNKAEDKFQLYNSYGLENKNIIFTSESRLISFFKKSGTPAIIKQVNGISGVGAEIQQELVQLKAVLCLPLIIHKDIIGFISLGRKKSDEEYSKDDLDVLLDLARTESIAVGNAQLLQEAAQAERRAAIGTMSAGINHEIGNPLNIMSTKIQVFKLSRQKGLFKDKPNEEILDQAEEALDECLKQSGRISEITKKLSNFAKPSKEFKPQLVDILEEIDETLSMVGHDLELEKISIEKNISSGLCKILADKREIQQIFFNIIRNAAQAIEETGKITISAVNTTNSKVHIEIHDTGKGIPDDKAHRIFEPFFTTKGPNKGTGLGLSIVRQLVWKNKGEISFKSQVGAGTTFILEFPEADV